MASGCSPGTHVPPGAPGIPAFTGTTGIDGAVETTAAGRMDPRLDIASEGYRDYLIGQLLYKDERFDEAEAKLEQAARLVKGPAPEIHARLAELGLRSGDLPKALRESRKALESRPDDVGVLLLEAGILDALGRDAEAVGVYRRVLTATPERTEAVFLLAALHLKRREPDAAVGVLAEAAARAPTDPVVSYFLARAHESAGDLAKATSELERAVRLDPDDAGLRMDLVRVLLRDKKSARAKKLLRGLVAKNPNDHLAHRVLGQLLLGENRYEEALSHLRAGGDEAPDSVRLRVALSFIRRERYADAERELSLLLAKNPSDPRARFYLGSVCFSTGRRKEAVGHFLKVPVGTEQYAAARTVAVTILRQDKAFADAVRVVSEAVRADPSGHRFRYLRVSVLREAGRGEEALEELDGLVARDSADPRLLFFRGTILRELGRVAESDAAMRDVLSKDPESSEAMNSLAYSLAEQRADLPEAERLARRALELKPGDWYYTDTLGWVLFRSGDAPGAEAELVKAAEASGGDAVVLEHLGDVEAALGKVAEARVAYARALERLRRGADEPDGPGRRDGVARLEKKIAALDAAGNAVGGGER